MINRHRYNFIQTVRSLSHRRAHNHFQWSSQENGTEGHLSNILLQRFITHTHILFVLFFRSLCSLLLKHSSHLNPVPNPRWPLFTHPSSIIACQVNCLQIVPSTWWEFLIAEYPDRLNNSSLLSIFMLNALISLISSLFWGVLNPLYACIVINLLKGGKSNCIIEQNR